MIPFKKMNGLGNDFVVIDARTVPFSLTTEQIVAVADRKRGVGFDQMLVLKPSDVADFFMVVINADGTTDTVCGNGTRCVAQLFMDETGRKAVAIETIAGVVYAEKYDAMVRVNMGHPKTAWQDMPMGEPRDVLHVAFPEFPELPSAVVTSMGIPHTVFFVPDAENIALDYFGPVLETHPLFPQRTNVEFCHLISSNKIRMRVWERGSGITQACGSGACCVLVAAVQRGLVKDHAEIVMDGGSLHIEWRNIDGCVYMTGPTQLSFSGVLEPGLLASAG